MTEEIKDAQFDETISNNEKVLVDFFATWCGPCKMLAPVLDELTNELKDVKIAKINVDENRQKASEFGVMSIPTMIFFKNGKKVEEFTGFLPKEQLKEKIESTFS